MTERVVCFPDDFRGRLLHEPRILAADVKLLGSFSLAEVCRRAVAAGISGPPLVFSFSQTRPYYYVVARGFSPVLAVKPSPGSAARYLLQAELAEDFLLLLQHLPITAKTSRHFHNPPGKEAYHLLEGAGELVIGENSFMLFPGKSRIVEPAQVHRYVTHQLPALTILEIAGIAGCLRKENHHYVDEGV